MLVKSRQGKREVLRRKAAYNVKNAETKRTLLSLEDLLQYIAYIDNNQTSKFGIIKISSFSLDSVFTVPTTGKRLTLISHANSMGRDRIVSALIRAGCDPSIYPGAKEEHTRDISSLLLDLPLTYGVWLVRFMYSMIDSSLQGGKECDDKRCERCHENLHVEAGGSISILWNCGHLTCIDCAWVGATRKLNSTQYALRCPVCNCRCDGSEDLFYMLPNPQSVLVAESGDNHITLSHEALLSCHTNIERKLISKASWAKLPPDIDSCDPPSRNSKLKISPGPMHSLALHFVGTVQSQRSLEFHKAATTGHIYRLYWLLRCGVDVDACDEYGESALIAACIHGQMDSVQFLVWAGADGSIRDNCDANAYEAALSNNHEKIAAFILQHYTSCASDRSRFAISHLSVSCLPQCSDIINHNDVAITTLIPLEADHLGSGSCYIDNCFSEQFLSHLEELWAQCPETPPTKASCSSRYYIGDSVCLIRSSVSRALALAKEAYKYQLLSCRESSSQCARSFRSHSLQCSNIFAHMRFLRYSTPGGSLPPHEDLSRTDIVSGQVSTHTFILYLTNCSSGGETILLKSMSDVDNGVRVQPRRGRLLLFPHKCIHEGSAVVDCPKLLLRGEAY